MKKTYINPTVEIVELEQEAALLAGSATLGIDQNIDAETDALSRELGLDEESLIFGF